MPDNPYAPPKTPVEDATRRPAATSRQMPFWAAFYLSPTGRTGRLFYWLFGFLPLALLGAGFGVLLPRTLETTRYLLTGAILLLWPQVVILARRFHDINLTGWLVTVFWVLPFALILSHAPLPPATGTIIGWLGAIVLGLIPGTRGPNRYGNDPTSQHKPAGSQSS